MICEVNNCSLRATRKTRRITSVIYRWKYLCGKCSNRIKKIAENSYSTIIEEVKL